MDLHYTAKTTPPSSQYKGHHIRVIIRVLVEYGQYITYGRADRKVKDGITFEQNHFNKIHELYTASKHFANSGSATFGWQRSLLEQVEH